MKYPRLQPAIRFLPTEDGWYKAYNELLQEDEDCPSHFSYELVRFARRLDGRDPYTLGKEDAVTEMLAVLHKNGLLMESRVDVLGTGTALVTLILPKNSTFQRALGKIWNTLLLCCWLPMLVLGILHFFRAILSPPYADLRTDFILGGALLGLAAGMTLHELSHAAAGWAYGARVFRMGVLASFFMPGAFVEMNEHVVRHPLKLAQINAAGVESNFLLTGLCLGLAVHIPVLSGALIAAALNNLVLGVVNLMLISDSDGLHTDGMNILGTFFGARDLFCRMNAIVHSAEARKHLRSRGAAGHAAIAAAYILTGFRYCLPSLTLLNILEMILWIVL